MWHLHYNSSLDKGNYVVMPCKLLLHNNFSSVLTSPCGVHMSCPALTRTFLLTISCQNLLQMRQW